MLPFYECLPEGELGPLQHERDFDVPKASHHAVHPVDLNAAFPLEVRCPLPAVLQGALYNVWAKLLQLMGGRQPA